MSSRTDLNEAALNMTNLLTLITGMNDEQLDALMINPQSAYLLKVDTLNMLRFAVQSKERGDHL